MTPRILFILLFGLSGCGMEPGEWEYYERAPSVYNQIAERFSLDSGCSISDRQWTSGRDFTQTRPDDWEPTCFYPTALRATGRYVSDDFSPFEVTVDAPNPEHFARMTPYEVAELVFWMTQAHSLMELPCTSSLSPYDLLSKGHFIVVEDKEVFKQLYHGDKLKPRTTAFIRSHIYGGCYEAPADVYWTSVIMEVGWNRQGVGLIVHEMTHVMSIAVNGHSDPEHLDPRLWSDAGGEDSLQALVIDLHACTYFPDRCNGLASQRLFDAGSN